MSRFRYLLLLFVVSTLWACDKVPLTSPTGSTVTLTVSNTSIPINGTTQVLAAVIESAGTAVHDGTIVTFSGSFGTFTPSEAPTVGGVARTVFTGTGSGTAKIGAFSGSAKATEVEVKVGGAAAGSVAMRSEPAALPQGGGSVQVVATVRDSSGNSLPNAPVNFTSDQGNLSTTAAVTDANGEARVTLNTTRDTVVTATVIGTVTATTTVRIISAPSVTIALAAGSTPAVGVSTNFTVTPAVSTSGTSIQNVTLNWGDQTAEQSLGPISGATNVTHSFANTGNYSVVATATDATGQRSSSTLSVNVQRIAPTVTITPSTSTTTAGSTLAFSVSATPGTGGPPVQNIRVVVSPGGQQIYSGPSGGGFTHTFTTAGTHTLTATATDSANSTGSATAVVTVGTIESTLVASGTGLTCNTSSPMTCTTLAAGTNVTFTAAVTTAGQNGVSYAWNWGDGSPQETTTARINSHRYTTAGSYVAQVTITTSSGATTSQILFLRP